MPGPKSTSTAAGRIAAAFDPARLRSLAEELAALLGEHLVRVEGRQARVLNWIEPQQNVAAAQSQIDAVDAAAAVNLDPQDLRRRFRELAELCLARANNLHHPRYIGHQVPAPIPLAGLFDAIGSVTNQVMAIYEMGPFATGVEHALVARLGEALGFDPRTAGGVVTSGGSLANLTGLLAARNVALGNAWRAGLADRRAAPVLVTHADSHYSVARSAGILGLGTDQIVPIRLDPRRRIDPNHLDETLADLRRRGVPIVATSACACATPIGAFDPLEEIAEVCRRHEVWMHVDAAHGGAAAFSDRYRHLVAGLAEADSVVCDAHKMLFVPALCAFVFYRDRARRFAAFEQTAPYLFDPSAPGMAEYDCGLVTIECTKRAAAFGLWGVWSLFGRQLFADLVETTFDLGSRFYELLAAADDFQPLHEPECNIVAFRHLPRELAAAPQQTQDAFQLKLRRSLIESGEFYIVPCRIDGQSALRVTIINPLTTEEDLVELLAALRRHGQRVLNSSSM
jgi:L-2,4-diaminobutyrate decarboxylase